MMNCFSLELLNNALIKATVIIDGKTVAPKKRGGSEFYCMKTEKSSVNVKIYRKSELAYKNWFIYSLLFFIISIFGIFDVRDSNDGRTCEIDFDAKTSMPIRMRMVPQFSSGIAVEYLSPGVICENKNVSYIDDNVKKRAKILKFTFIALRIIGVIAIAAIIIKIGGNL